jgi:hypothetical protein
LTRAGMLQSIWNSDLSRAVLFVGSGAEL